VSGVRGIIGLSITPHVVEKYVTAFGILMKGKKIVVGRDSRVSGRWVAPLATSLLLALGYEVVDIDIVPTPTVPPSALSSFLFFDFSFPIHFISFSLSLSISVFSTFYLLLRLLCIIRLSGAIHGTTAAC
jgi:hypothetical protein